MYSPNDADNSKYLTALIIIKRRIICICCKNICRQHFHPEAMVFEQFSRG